MANQNDKRETAAPERSQQAAPRKSHKNRTLIMAIVIGVIIAGFSFGAGVMVGSHGKTGSKTMSRPSGFPGGRGGQRPSGSGQMTPPSGAPNSGNSENSDNSSNSSDSSSS